MSDDKLPVLPRGRRLPYWEKPRSAREAIAKINNAGREWEKTTEDFIYRAGKWFVWLKERSAHGDFERLVNQTRFKIRTVRNFMKYAVECDTSARIMPYHPNPKVGVKPATVAVLEAPEDPEYVKNLKANRPQHDSEPLNWSAAETAEQIFKIFEKLTERRKIKEVEDVVNQLEELLREYVESRRDNQSMIRGGGVVDDDADFDENERR